MSGPVFIAMWQGTCFWCGREFAPGDELRMFERRAHCAEHELDDEGDWWDE